MQEFVRIGLNGSHVIRKDNGKPVCTSKIVVQRYGPNTLIE